ncbi:MAG: hypothetical protein H6926_08365 [Chromatiales bacterium]|nr:hypothetical protein [Chromatiales bacterium]
MGDKFKVTIGMSVNKEGSPDFFDGGLVYHNMPYDKVVAVEAVFAKYAAALTQAMEPIVQELVAMGVAEAEARAAVPTVPNGAIR